MGRGHWTGIHSLDTHLILKGNLHLNDLSNTNLNGPLYTPNSVSRRLFHNGLMCLCQCLDIPISQTVIFISIQLSSFLDNRLHFQTVVFIFRYPSSFLTVVFIFRQSISMSWHSFIFRQQSSSFFTMIVCIISPVVYMLLRLLSSFLDSQCQCHDIPLFSDNSCIHF